MTSEEDTRVFLLVGKTGTGKSATGNSILGIPAFKCADASISVTSDISMSSQFRLGYTLTVVDAPGVMDTSVNSTEAKWKSCREMIQVMSICPTSGKLAILLILKYGDRFTEESKATIHILKNIFGEENLWKTCIIIFTHGDLFDTEYDGEKRFEDWLKEQNGELGKIIENCGLKCVLFQNKTKSLLKQEEQINQLMGFVDHLDQGYTKTKFHEAKKQQNRLELEGMLPKLKLEFQRLIDSLIANMDNMIITSASEEEVMELENLTRQLLARVDKMDDPNKIFYVSDETRLLKEVRAKVECLLAQINLRKATVRMMKKADVLKTCVHDLMKNIDLVSPRDVSISSHINQIEKYAESLWSKIAHEKLSPQALSILNPIVTLAKQKISRLKIDFEFAQKARKFNLVIDGLQDEVTSQKIPTLVSTFTIFTERADKILTEISADSLEEQDKIHLTERIKDLKTQIYNLKIDNDMNIGWTSTSVITGVISVFTAFIPVVGIPISIGLNAAPVVGQIIHRAVERSRRETEAGKDKKK